MTQSETIVEAFKRHGYRMTLGEILQFPWGYKFTSRASDLRKEGFTIICQKAKSPSDNTYTMACPESNGQLRLV